MKRPTMFLTMLLTGLLLGWPHSAASKRVVAEGRQYLSLDEVEASLCDEIIETLVDDIFNASVAQW